MDLAGELRAGSEELGISLQQSQYDQLLEYLRLLAKWNQVYNLTAITEPRKMLSHHLLDSLSLMPSLLQANKVLDVGSGAGLPGIPLAIAMPCAMRKLCSRGFRTIMPRIRWISSSAVLTRRWPISATVLRIC
jgi:16S rRNA G527 N7-methylase RsmG